MEDTPASITLVGAVKAVIEMVSTQPNAHAALRSRGMTIPSLTAYETLFRTSGLSSIGSD